jgi:hypothetical protein
MLGALVGSAWAGAMEAPSAPSAMAAVATDRLMFASSLDEEDETHPSATLKVASPDKSRGRDAAGGERTDDALNPSRGSWRTPSSEPICALPCLDPDPGKTHRSSEHPVSSGGAGRPTGHRRSHRRGSRTRSRLRWRSVRTGKRAATAATASQRRRQAERPEQVNAERGDPAHLPPGSPVRPGRTASSGSRPAPEGRRLPPAAGWRLWAHIVCGPGNSARQDRCSAQTASSWPPARRITADSAALSDGRPGAAARRTRPHRLGRGRP